MVEIASIPATIAMFETRFKSFTFMVFSALPFGFIAELRAYSQR